MSDEIVEVEERFIKLIETGQGQYKVESNIEDWPQQIKLMAAAIRDAELKRELGI